MDLLGKILGNYRTDRLLGEGGMGAVYQAYDLTLHREVAIKFIHPHLARRADFRQRFMQEARLMAHLDHPGIVRVYHMSADKDLLYLPMEFIRGGNLRQLLDELLRQGKWIPLSEAVLLVQQLCQTVHYAHQKGVLHRDIKPANLMLKPEPTAGLPFRIVLTDLGLAKLLEGLGMTQEGTSMGTPAYMSPEQASGQPTDPRSDVYSLGILLYELTVGRLPFPIRSLTEATRFHTQVPPPAPRSIRSDLPEELEHVILKALEKDPNDRYPSARDLESALAALTIFGTSEVASVSTAMGDSEPDQETSLITEYEKSIVADPRLSEASLATVFDPGLASQRGISVFADLSMPAGTQPLLQITHQDKSSTTLPLPSGTTTLGRDKENPIVLQDEKASRRHAQIMWDGAECHIIDLDSSNGTFLDNTRLLPGVPETWHPNQVLRIGDTWLRFIAPGRKAESILSSTTVFHTSTGAGVVAVAVDPQHLQVQAGGTVSARITLLNQSPEVDHFSLSLTGIPVEWISSLPARVQLMPGQQQETACTLQVPRAPESQAGPHPLTLTVSSQREPSQSVDVRLLLSVEAYSQFESSIQPQRLRTGQSGSLTIANHGNQAETFTILLKDMANELSFQPPQLEVEVPAGKSANKNFQAQLRETRWIGGRKHHPFTATIRLPKADPQTLHAEVLSRGLIPPWLPPVIILLCFSFLGLLGLIGPRLLPTPTPTLTSSATPELGAPIVEEWCVYLSDGPAPTSFTDCGVQVAAEVGEQLIIQWRVSNADEVIIEPFGNRPLSGEMRVTATEGMSAFGLKASNAAGKTTQRSVQINVISPTVIQPPTTVAPTNAIPPTIVAENNAVPPTTAPPPLPATNIDDVIHLPGPPVAANQVDHWVLAMDDRILVITDDGSVFAHAVTANSVTDAIHLPGPPVAANQADRWVLAMDDRILVITGDGSTFTHAVQL